MTTDQIRTAWREVETLIAASSLLIKHADCTGPLADRPTSDPGVQVVLRARRHLLKRAKRLRQQIGVEL